MFKAMAVMFGLFMAMAYLYSPIAVFLYVTFNTVGKALHG